MRLESSDFKVKKKRKTIAVSCLKGYKKKQTKQNKKDRTSKIEQMSNMQPKTTQDMVNNEKHKHMLNI